MFSLEILWSVTTTDEFITFKPLQCNKESCWCTFLDSGLAIQTLPFVSRNESIICPKRYLTSKNPCTINNSPAGCSGRASSYKYVFDEVQGKCKQMRACSGFDDFETCQKSCGKLKTK